MRISTFILLPILIAAFFPHESRKPFTVLWAWERPEKLNFIDTRNVGVAYLAKTITLRGDKTLVRPRLQPLEVPEGTRLTAVVRIETSHPSLSAAQLQQTASEISGLSATSAVQIDFDAAVSERDFYRQLLQRVRQQLPSSIQLSITALASWCARDNWIDHLPVNAIPMLFRMGAERPQFQRRLEIGEPFESAICRGTAGVSTDEPVNVQATDRLYIFNPEPWTKDSYDRAMEIYKR